jgi:hypothetical protein
LFFVANKRRSGLAFFTIARHLMLTLLCCLHSSLVASPAGARVFDGVTIVFLDIGLVGMLVQTLEIGLKIPTQS